MKTSGLAFVKMDLQVHTPASECFEDKGISASQIVAEALKKGLAAIAITDHNSGNWIDPVKVAANGKPLTILPGVELTVGDAHVHIVALLDVSSGTAEINALLARLGVMPNDIGKRETFIDKSVNEVIDLVTGPEFHGLCFLAHVDSSSGVFKDMDGQPRIDIVRNPNLLAVEAVDVNRALPYVDGRDPNYRRKLAIIQSSDNPTLDANGARIVAGDHAGKHSVGGIGYRFTYFKVDDKPSLESVRQCFIDPDVRIRLMSDFKTSKYPFIKSLKVTGGFLDGTHLEFHPGLNSVLGGKGVGKSLVVEFARFALNQESDQEEILADHQSKLFRRLEQYGTIELEFCDETGKITKVKRTFNEAEGHPFDEETRGAYVSQLFPALFVSQNEIIKIAEDPDQQLHFIDKFFDFHTIRDKIDHVQDELGQLDGEFTARLKAVHKKTELEKKKTTIEKEIEKLNKQLSDPIFKTFSPLEEKNRLIVRQENFLDGIAKDIAGARILDRYSPPEIPLAFKNDPLLKRTNDVLLGAIQKAKDDMGILIENVKASLQAIQEEHKKFEPEFIKEKQSFEDTVRKSGGDIKALEAARKKQNSLLEETMRQLSQTEGLVKELGLINETRNGKLDEYFALHAEYFSIRKAKSERIEKDCDEKVKIEIRESSNRAEFRRRLQQLKVGSYLSADEIRQITEKMNPADFIRSVLRFDVSQKEEHIDAISKVVGIDLKRILRLVTFLLDNLEYEELLALQYQVQPEDRPFISLRMSDGSYQTLDRLSVGQKCVAMLMIALSEGSMPIVIDQPEDSLDIRSIWEDMCLRLRSGKENRQFIFTTHNSSIAVASDTDKFTIMEADANKGKMVFQGSLDHEPIKKEVIKYLEGGDRTYFRKFKKYYRPETNAGAE